MPSLVAAHACARTDGVAGLANPDSGGSRRRCQSEEKVCNPVTFTWRAFSRFVFAGKGYQLSRGAWAGALLAGLLALPASGNDESGISTTPTAGQPVACLEEDLRNLLERCIASNQTNPPPGNPGPFTRGYKEMVFLMGQCFSGGFASLTNLGSNVIVGAAADSQKVARTGQRTVPGSEPLQVMVWADLASMVIQQNSNAPLKAILDFVRTINPDTNAVTPPPAYSPGGDSIVLGDPTNILQPSNSFHAVLFGGFSDIAGKQLGQVKGNEWLVRLASINGGKAFNRLLRESLHVPEENITNVTAGTYLELQSLITNAWAKMNDNEQFFLFIADHGSRHCMKTNVVIPPGALGFSASFPTPAFFKDPDVRQPRVGLQTIFVGQPGDVLLNRATIGQIFPNPDPMNYDFVFNPNLIRPVGETNTIEVVVPNFDAGIDLVDFSTGPVLGSDFNLGTPPFASVFHVTNATGFGRTNFHLIFEGQLDNLVTSARQAQADGTPIADWATGGSTIIYDAANDVTGIGWQDSGNPIPPGGCASFSVQNSSLSPLKASWSPISTVSDGDLAPVNLLSVQAGSPGEFVLNLVAEPMVAATQTVTMEFRIEENRIPLAAFYFTDPAVTNLSVFSTQMVTLEPEAFISITSSIPVLSDLSPLPTLIVESRTTWGGDLNPNDVWRLDQFPLPSYQDFSSTNLCPGEGAIMTVNLTNQGVFMWYCNGDLLPDQTNSTLIVTNLTGDQNGTIYTCIASNAAEFKKKYFQNIVVDDSPPVLTGPSDITVTAPVTNGAVVTFGGFFVSDTCGVINSGTFQQSHFSGSLFPVGLTRVDASIADTFGNAGKYSFFINVLPPGGGGGGGALDLNHEDVNPPIGDPVDGLSGGLYLTESPDLNVGGSGLRVFIQRHYDARLLEDGLVNSALGRNWQHNYDLTLSTNGTNATVVFREGRIIRFGRDGANWNLTGRADIPFQLVETGSEFLLADPRSQFMYFFANGLLTRIEDGRGNTNFLLYDGSQLTNVTDGLNRNLDFTYDESGFLTNVSDRFRSVSFGHTGSNLASFVDALGRTTTYAYDPVNTNNPALMTGRTLPEGNTPLASVYDAQGRVISQTDAAGNLVRMAYLTNAGNRISFYTNAVGDTQVQTYNSNGQLAKFTDEAGNSLIMTSDSAGRRNSVTDRLGHTTQITYDNANGFPTLIDLPSNPDELFTYATRPIGGVNAFDLTQSVHSDGTTNRFAHDAQGNLIFSTNRIGDVWAYDYNNRGQVVAVTNPLGGKFNFTYDANARLSSSTDSDIGVTTYGYDALNRLTHITHPDLDTVQFAYNALDQVTSITDERTNTTLFQYDANSRLTNAVDTLGQTTRFEYDGLNRLTRSVDRLGAATTFGYDSRSLLALVTNRNGFISRYEYDERQRLTGIVNPGGVTNSFAYDDEGLLIAAGNPLGQTFRIQRDAMGYVVQLTDPLTNSISFGRDAMKRITNITDALGRSLTLSYDRRGLLTNATRSEAIAASYRYNPLGQLTNIVDPGSNEWNFAHTSIGRLTNFSDPLGRTTIYEYGFRGRINRVTHPDGVVQTNIYDGADNLVQSAYSDGTLIAFAYDPLNRVTNASASPPVAFEFDVEDHLTHTRQEGLDFGASYDPGGRLTSVSYGNNLFSVAYVYDSRDRLIHVSDTLTGQGMGFGYDDADRLIGISRSNDVSTTYTYDERGLITRIQHGSMIDIHYALDADGQIAEVDYQIVPLDPTIVVSNESVDYSYDAASQVSSAGYEYDARGRLTNAPNTAFQWDGASRLVRLDTVELGYNALNDVVTRVEGGNTNHYFYNYALGLGAIVAERNDNTGQFTRFYIWSPAGALLYLIELPQMSVSYPHFDKIGSTLALTDTNGVVTDAYAYEPYGRLLGQTGSSTQPFRFNGAFGVRAEGSLYHMRARWYDPATARFLSRDPVWPVLTNPKKLNSYAFALQNPIRFTDPAGTKDFPFENFYDEDDIEPEFTEHLDMNQWAKAQGIFDSQTEETEKHGNGRKITQRQRTGLITAIIELMRKAAKGDQKSAKRLEQLLKKAEKFILRTRPPVGTETGGGGAAPREAVAPVSSQAVEPALTVPDARPDSDERIGSLLPATFPADGGMADVSFSLPEDRAPNKSYSYPIAPKPFSLIYDRTGTITHQTDDVFSRPDHSGDIDGAVIPDPPGVIRARDPVTGEIRTYYD